MILIDCPFCEAQVTTSLPLPAALRCDACAVTVDVTDARVDEVELAA